MVCQIGERAPAYLYKLYGFVWKQRRFLPWGRSQTEWSHTFCRSAFQIDAIFVFELFWRKHSPEPIDTWNCGTDPFHGKGSKWMRFIWHQFESEWKKTPFVMVFYCRLLVLLIVFMQFEFNLWTMRRWQKQCIHKLYFDSICWNEYRFSFPTGNVTLYFI